MAPIFVGALRHPFSPTLSAAELRPVLGRSLTPSLSRRWLRQADRSGTLLLSVALGRQFTHERLLAESAIRTFIAGLEPILEARRLGALLFRFPPDFRFCKANRDHLIVLRRAFHRFFPVAELPHESWEASEARAVLIDHQIGLVSTDLSVTSNNAYVRFSGRTDFDWLGRRAERAAAFSDRVILMADTQETAIGFLRRWPRLGSPDTNQRGFNFDRAVA